MQTNLTHTHTINTKSYQWMFDLKHGYMYNKYFPPPTRISKLEFTDHQRVSPI